MCGRKRGPGKLAQQGDHDIGELVYWKVGPYLGGRSLSAPGKWHNVGGKVGA